MGKDTDNRILCRDENAMSHYFGLYLGFLPQSRGGLHVVAAIFALKNTSEEVFRGLQA
jgi:hypothetical protein